MTHQAEISETKDQMYYIHIGENARLINLHPEEPSLYNIDVTSEAELINLISEDFDEDNSSNDRGVNALDEEGCQNSTGEAVPLDDSYTVADVLDRVGSAASERTTASSVVDDIEKALGKYYSTYNPISTDSEKYLVDGGTLWFADQSTKLWRAIRGPEDLVSTGAVNTESSKVLYLSLIRSRNLRKDAAFDEMRSHYVSFKDSVLDIDTGEIRPRMLDDRIQYCLNLELQRTVISEYSEKDFAEKMKRFAGTPESYHRLQELCGIALSAAPHDRVIYVVGMQNRYAAVVTKFLRAVVDSDFVSFVSLKDLDRQFGPADLIGKHLALASMQGEVFLQDIEMMLRIANGDGIHADRKHSAAVDFVPTTTLVFTGRKLPRVRDSLFEDAAELIDYVRLSGTPDPALLGRSAPRKYRNEFVSWALEGLRRYLQHGLTPLPLADSLSETASVRAFFDECVVTDPESGIFTQKLMEAYRAFCNSNSLTPVHRSILLQCVREMYGLKSQTVRDGAITGSGYRGIRIVAKCSTEDDDLREYDDEDLTQPDDRYVDDMYYKPDFEHCKIIGDE